MGPEDDTAVTAHTPRWRAPAGDAADLAPPWTDAATLATACTRCGACVAACPERIIVIAKSGLPAVDFHRGECTFCGDCASACPAPVFDRARAVPWWLNVRITSSCLAARRIVCQSCRDACPTGAIQFRPRPGGMSLPGIVADRCNGCGACVSVCPSDAISISMATHES
jgi:ferredoxin-type protein NapF